MLRYRRLCWGVHSTRYRSLCVAWRPSVYLSVYLAQRSLSHGVGAPVVVYGSSAAETAGWHRAAATGAAMLAS